MNNDLISRAALREIFEYTFNQINSDVEKVLLGGVLAVIDMAPAVDAEPVRHGLWRKINVPKNWGGPVIRCSECNTGGTRMWNYCPNCGAKMNLE